MAIPARRTPCVGICSTTYGDLVCRGCKRFAHEIVDWNSYTDDQHARVWRRLHTLRDACVERFVGIGDARRFDSAVAELKLPEGDTHPAALIYELLRRRARVISSLVDVGLVARTEASTPRTVRDAIDNEFFARSRAAYERSFHTPVDG